jgi:hypothetical protein
MPIREQKKGKSVQEKGTPHPGPAMASNGGAHDSNENGDDDHAAATEKESTDKESTEKESTDKESTEKESTEKESTEKESTLKAKSETANHNAFVEEGSDENEQ